MTLNENCGLGWKINIFQTAANNRAFELAFTLLEVRDDGLVVALRSDSIRDTHMAFVPWNIVSRVKAITLPGIQSTTPHAERRRENAIKKFRIVSRYPQGLSPELLDRLLASFDQKTMDIIEN